jgi:hypothetical protein
VTIETLEILAVFLITITSLISLLTSDWRASIFFLVVQFTVVFLLVALVWPLVLAVTVLIAGWLSCAILAMAVIGLPRQTIIAQRLNPAFNFLSAILIFLAVFSFAPQLQKTLPQISFGHCLAGLTLIGFGLLRLALDSNPLSTSAALLSLIAGFEVIFVNLTAASFAVGALAVITLFIALAGAYLILAPYMEETD